MKRLLSESFGENEDLFFLAHYFEMLYFNCWCKILFLHPYLEPRIAACCGGTDSLRSCVMRLSFYPPKIPYLYPP
jgi:hypothetical protein